MSEDSITIATSVRVRDVDQIDEIGNQLQRNSHFKEYGVTFISRSAVLRSMIRFTLSDLAEYRKWVEKSGHI